MTKYDFRSGGQTFGGISAQVVGRELEYIRSRHGKLQTEVVVEKARNPRSPLHPAFQWDVGKAARAHWMWQARELIREIVVVVAGGERTEPAFIHVRIVRGDVTEGYYQSTAVIVNRPDEMQCALEESRAKLQQAEVSFKMTAIIARRSKRSATTIRKISRIASTLGKLHMAVPQR